ncbi:GTP-binding signal recognition particle [Asticcacaulis biprosthecium C19]|uniref:GTP-binding signal recognition particle n=1 Tax=Asticcacaulis biprosthecium C19 TaxID=715226 RepID=F4QJQ3_9CAUL|nr:GxxExxY protein [Asticcacaulis biprosthecium]EGF92004.1 GTP-binding signal recognition particle [Asticcacaulis biprosthecium C19]
MNKLLFEDEAFAIRGAIFEVYREMGCGFLEAVYQDCLEQEFIARQIPFSVQPVLTLAYKGKNIARTYSPDFLCYGQIILELKAVEALADQHRAQVRNYLKASGLPLGLLVNFGTYPKVQIERLLM